MRLLVLAAISGLFVGGAARGAPRSGGSVAVAPSSGEVFVADTDNDAVVVVSADGARVLRHVSVTGGPEQVVVDAHGRAYVTLRRAGEVACIEPGAHEAARRVAAGREPFGLALADGRLYVSVSGEAAVLELHPSDLAERRRVSVDPSPRGLALSPDGTRLFVAHLTTPSVTVVPLWSVKEPLQRIALPGVGENRRANLAFALALSSDGKSLFIPHVESDVGAEVPLGSRRSGYGGGVPSPVLGAVARVHLESNRASTWIPDDETVFSQPRAVTVDPASGRVFVAGLGSDDVRVLVPGRRGVDRAESLRVERGSGPKALALSADGKRLYVWASFKHQLLTLDATRPRQKALARVLVGGEPLPPAAAHGRELFFAAGDRRISADGVLACASCHPEGRQDGLVWRLADGPRKTPILAGRLEGTAPYDWLGEHATVTEHVRNTITKRLGGSGLAAPDLADLNLYIVHYLEPPATPNAQAARIARGRELFHSDDVGCASCHRAERHFSDGARHDIASISDEEAESVKARAARDALARFDEEARVRRLREEADLVSLRSRLDTVNSEVALSNFDRMLKILGERTDAERRMKVERSRLESRIRALEVDAPRELERQRREIGALARSVAPRQKYDTPSLVRVAQNGPYLHDGRARTLRELLVVFNADDRMGRTSQLSEEDLDALIAYLETL